MKIQLVAINAKYIHSNLAVYCLEAYAHKFGIPVEKKEYTINHNADDILSGVYLDAPDVVCFSCYIWNIPYVKELIRELKKLRPTTQIWVGGPEVSYHCEALLKQEPGIDGIMRQEGEETFVDLCKHWLEPSRWPLEEICGITYRKGEQIITNESRTAMDLNQLPFPYVNPKELEHRIYYYESSRGCPFSCSYCLSSLEKKLRFKALSKVHEELGIFLEWKVPQVKFVDRTFNAKKDHAMAVWQFLKDNDNGITNFHFEIAADLLDEEEIALLTSLRPGLVQLEIGVQSTNEETLREVHRSTKLSQIWANVEQLLAAGNCHVHLDLIAGLPYEGYERFKESFCDVYNARPHQLQLGFLKVLKGSYIEEHNEEYENRYHDRPPYEIMATKWISYDEILKLKNVEEMVETYYNSGQHKTVLKALEQVVKNPFSLYEQLGEYYNKNNPSQGKVSRTGKMDILLGYAASVDPDRRELYQQAGLYDLYLRENLKSRPVHAPKLTKEQCVFKKEQGVEKHMEIFDYDFVSGSCEKEATTVVFHYDDRSPITWDARVEKVYER